MKRYPAYDPPEYVNWQADAQVLDAYVNTVDADPRRREIIRALTPAAHLALYEGLLRNRLHDIALKRWVKQGVISKAWLGTGEEATTIGAVHALNRGNAGDERAGDYVAPMIRNAGACHEMGMSLADMFRGYLGTADSPTRGRDLHIGDFHHGVIAPVSPVGDIIAVTAGVALSFKLKGESRLALTWIGDGSTKSGVFHEAMNFCAVQGLPMIVIIQNNQVALGTRLEQHHRSDFNEWHTAYGVPGMTFDGNHVLDAYAATKIAAEGCRNGEGPFLLLSETFRMGGHATHDEREARATFDATLFEYWGKRDPIALYESYLIEGTLDLESGRRMRRTPGLRERNAALLQQSEARVLAEIDKAEQDALVSAKTRLPVPESAGEGVYGETSKAAGQKFKATASD
jgi:pyruvate dehydrogenase E1 component alpha subunit/2-oxoisovalerate dehydrogenase E1 component alpha subunit